MGTDRQPGGQERALGREWQTQGPVERAKALGVGEEASEGLGGGRNQDGEAGLLQTPLAEVNGGGK